MRKALIAILAVTSSAALLGCEDGPNQTFSSSPAGAAARWNDGTTPGSFDKSAMQGFVTNTAAGANAQEICSGPKRAATWANMVLQPIAPPGECAGLNGFGNSPANPNAWTGITIAQAEAVNCQSEPSGVTFGDADTVNQWGDNGEVWVKYNPNTQLVDWFVLNNGYQGKMTFQSRDGSTPYVIQLGNQILKGGAPIKIDYGNHTQIGNTSPPTFDPASYEYVITDFVDAIFATFAPELAAEDPTHGTCVVSGRCQQTNFGTEAVTRIYPLGLHIWVDDPSGGVSAADPQTPVRVDMRLPRIEPYTYAYTVMKLDEEGPTATTLSNGPSGTPCKLQLGTNWGDFLNNCISTTRMDAFYNKLIGSIQHDDERYVFNVTGVDVNATSRTLGATDVLHDADRPADADEVSSLYIDAATLGFMANDAQLNPDGTPVTDPVTFAPTKDFHGSGLVYLEYGRLVQETLNALILAQDPTATIHHLGDPDCLADVASSGSIAANCTGFEGIVTAAPTPTDTTQQDAANRLGPTATQVADGGLGLGLKPGHPEVIFCNDATGYVPVDPTMPKGDQQLDPNGYADCSALDLFDGSFQQVINTLGHGDVNNLPSAARDRRFFFRAYVTALMKLFKGTKLDGTTPDSLATVNLVDNDFFFDAEGGGQYERGEYVDRATEDAAQGLTDVEVVADILNGTLLSYQFFRSIYRGEAAVYGTVATDPTLPPGKEESGLTTNIYGSQLLGGFWTDHAAMDAMMNPLTPRSAYYCASTGWKTLNDYNQVNAECEGNIAPVDPSYVPDPKDKTAPPYLPYLESGVPMMKPYPLAFNTAGAPGGPLTLGSSNMMLVSENANDHTAVISVPQPAAGAPVNVVVPYTPPRPGFGWQYPLSGTRDELVESGYLDFAGTTLTGNMFYTTSPATDGSSNTLINLLAVQSDDYLGEVFLCIEPTSAPLSAADILRARMYDPVLPMLEWLDAHPAAYSDCAMLVRYSVFNNFPDYVISQAYGVELSATQGAGFGRINNLELFAPGSY